MKRTDSILLNFYRSRLPQKQKGGPLINPRGFMDGQPPEGSNWRIPGDTLYNPTPMEIHAVSDNGIEKTLKPFDKTQVVFPGAKYVDEYEMMYGGEKIPVRDVPTLAMGGLSANKAREILHHGEVHGHKLSDKQRRFFGAMSKGHTNKFQLGGNALAMLRDYGGGISVPRLNSPAPKMQNGGGFGVFGYVGDGWYQGGGQTSADSVRHQANKILQYEQLRGGPGGTPLSYYNDPRYMQMLMQDIYPEVKKILPNASAMEAGEAMDFIFNAGWDKTGKKILKDPRAYALQEYYKQYNPSRLDAEGKWSGRKNPAYSFDQEYNATIGKLPENERRVLMNRGRDWYYRNINNPAPGVPSDDYYNTWYGRIWNTNDYLPFNPNNPKFIPKKAEGGEMIRRADGSYSRRGLWDNIRENRGSGKKPTKQMLEQERKIKAKNK